MATGIMGRGRRSAARASALPAQASQGRHPVLAGCPYRSASRRASRAQRRTKDFVNPDRGEAVLRPPTLGGYHPSCQRAASC